MPRDGFDADYRPHTADGEDRRVGRKRNRTRTALVVAGVALVLVVAVVAIWRAVLVKIWEEDRQTRSEQDRRHMAQLQDDYERRNAAAVGVTRTEFENQVVGKSAEEVQAAVGLPDETEGEGKARNSTYFRRTINPTTGRLDDQVVVHFEGDKAVRVTYQ
jgi:flagellar biosynthesis/type III secretory pathway M-ring protein FliF/YscJ